MNVENQCAVDASFRRSLTAREVDRLSVGLLAFVMIGVSLFVAGMTSEPQSIVDMMTSAAGAGMAILGVFAAPGLKKRLEGTEIIDYETVMVVDGLTSRRHLLAAMAYIPFSFLLMNQVSTSAGAAAVSKELAVLLVSNALLGMWWMTFGVVKRQVSTLSAAGLAAARAQVDHPGLISRLYALWMVNAGLRGAAVLLLWAAAYATSAVRGAEALQLMGMVCMFIGCMMAPRALPFAVPAASLMAAVAWMVMGSSSALTTLLITVFLCWSEGVRVIRSVPAELKVQRKSEKQRGRQTAH